MREKVVCTRVPAACTEAGRKHGFLPWKGLTMGQRWFSLPREKEARTGLLRNEKLVELTSELKDQNAEVEGWGAGVGSAGFTGGVVSLADKELEEAEFR